MPLVHMQKFHKLVAGTLRYTLLFPLASLGFQGLLHPSMHAQFVSKAHHAETNLKKCSFCSYWWETAFHSVAQAAYQELCGLHQRWLVDICLYAPFVPCMGARNRYWVFHSCINDFFCLVYSRAGRKESKNGSLVLYRVGRLSYPVTIATDKQMRLKRLVIAESLHVQVLITAYWTVERPEWERGYTSS